MQNFYIVTLYLHFRKHMKEKFLADLRKCRENKKGTELSAALHNMRRRLDDPNLLSGELVHNILLSFRDIQDYDSMVKLVQDLQSVPNKRHILEIPVNKFLYAFALNRFVCLYSVTRVIEI